MPYCKAMRNVLLFRPESDMTETVFSVSSIFQVLHSLRKKSCCSLSSQRLLEISYNLKLRIQSNLVRNANRDGQSLPFLLVNFSSTSHDVRRRFRGNVPGSYSPLALEQNSWIGADITMISPVVTFSKHIWSCTRICFSFSLVPNLGQSSNLVSD